MTNHSYTNRTNQSLSATKVKTLPARTTHTGEFRIAMKLFIALVSMIVLLVATPNASANPSFTMDPEGDVDAPAIDLRSFGISSVGRGVVLNFTFHGRAPMPSRRISVCAVLNGRQICVRPDGRSIHIARKGVFPAMAMRRGNTIRVWFRLGLAGASPRVNLRGHAVTRLVNNGICSNTCVDRTQTVRHTFLPATQCVSGPRRVTNGSRRGAPRVALTFDDGPAPATSRILNILHRHNVPGTFYVTGNNVAANRRIIRRMVARGHEVANHSWAHERLPSATSLARTSNAIRRHGRFQTCTFRPPYGAANTALIRRAGARGMATVLWDIDTRDWQIRDANRIARIGASGRNGSIVLMHDGGGNRSATVAALPRIIQSYQARGFTFVTVDEMIGAVPSR